MKHEYYIMILFLIPINSSYVQIFANGMFSDMSNVLQDLRKSEREKTNMHVEWGPGFMYYQDEGYHGYSNSWEYYFDPIPPRLSDPISDANITGYVANCAELMKHYNYRHLYNELIKRYIHLKPYVQERINNFYNKFMRNKKVIGVHLRSNSKDVEAIPVPLYKIFNKLDEYKDYIFFIASDSWEFIDKCFKRFPEKCITLDKLNDPLLQYTDAQWIIEGSRAKAGEDAIVDAYLLSKCEKIIMNHMSSNVPLYALYLNLKLIPIILNP